MTTQSETKRISIHPDTHVGMLALVVSDLTRSLDFYTKAIGFQVLEHHENEATLGAAGAPLLHLTELAGAAEWPRGGRSYTGLYHFAILMPTRSDLGAWVKHWLDLGYQIGQGDHAVSEALYLEDPDGHGIEIYRDRPRDQWKWENGRVVMGTGPVDIKGMIEDAVKEGRVFEGLPAGTRLGHMHLQVGDIPEAERFYTQILGFDLVAAMPTALFVSAGGYHHHIGMNTWHSLGAKAPPEASVRLNFFTINVPTAEAMEEVAGRLDGAGLTFSRETDHIVVDDPWGNRVVIKVGGTRDSSSVKEIKVSARR